MPTPPNVLLLFTDMQRADTIGALGNPVIRTPHLDRLAREGTAFTRAYAPSPVCIPARYAMHYGRCPARTGLADNKTMPPDQGDSLPSSLAALGYDTAAIGKCHFTPDRLAMRGFGQRLVQEECRSDPERDDYCRFLRERGSDFDEPHGTRGEMYYIPQVSLHPAAEHPTQWVGDRTLDFLQSRQTSARPWFLFSSFIHPHPPFAPPKPWHKLYRSFDMPLPEAPTGQDALLCWVNHHQNRYKYRDRGTDLQLLRNIKAYYYATISFVDFQIGRIRQQLESSGQLENTLVIFASDHGEYLGDYGCFGKRGMHDASARVPLLFRWPGRFPAGQCCRQAASLVDIFPTVLAAAGGEPADRDLDGEDLSTLMANPGRRRFVYSQFQNGANAIHMIADDRYKYIWSCRDQREWLFDRLSDPRETASRASLPSCRAIKDELKNHLLAYLHRHGVPGAARQNRDTLEWQKHPPADESWRLDPDAGLLTQDHEHAPPSFPPEYTTP